MSKKRNRTNKEVCEFYGFLKKLNERLTIITDVNLSSGVDPIDDDIQLIHELHKFHEMSEMSWANIKNQVEVPIKQLKIEEIDKVAEK